MLARQKAFEEIKAKLAKASVIAHPILISHLSYTQTYQEEV